MNHERFGVTHVGEVARQPERIYRSAREVVVALDTKAQHAAVRIRAEQFLGAFVVRVTLVAQVRDPCDAGVFFEPAIKVRYGCLVGKKGRVNVLGERERVIAMSLAAQTERLEALNEEEGAKGVQCGPEVAQKFDAELDRKRNRPKRVTEDQPVIAL